MIEVLAYSKEKGFQELSIEQLREVDWDWYWVDFSEPTENEVIHLEKTFDFHPLAIEDCLHGLQRPKLDYYDDHTFFVVHSVHPKTLEREEIDVFLGKCSIVTFHKEKNSPLEQAKQVVKRSKQFDRVDEYYIFHQILDKVVDHYFPLIYTIEDHINEIEDNTKDLSMEKLLEALFDRRSELLTLRQTIHPMRDLLYRILNTSHLEGVFERREYFADIHDHLIKVADMVASNREMTQDIRDSYLSLNSHETNRTMQILTVISVIFMPLTFIVGVYGMNFVNMPELEAEYGYFAVWGVMLAVAIGMFFWFKNKGWFD
ncbi:magnesium/cobalt transporter CorA [Halobacillus karajensis]|uniref:Magnesium transport protein CorA n=1 Tax=Halobacillus karajensis TaxID=195088 RepID=A0A024P4C8_9BACI|nr:magnesium/cobalt transporter CorA [Halobacillus karajensis]CDQ19977.1 Magnesium transport protein CorA [Halobacillus karajensis]CDQ22437.1 Magnesium transport protein CorA [Halobacillus karajensis]CDQ28280.1 Magnesium transport protein CorA [Halobacillus karajensis]